MDHSSFSFPLCIFTCCLHNRRQAAKVAKEAAKAAKAAEGN